MDGFGDHKGWVSRMKGGQPNQQQKIFFCALWICIWKRKMFHKQLFSSTTRGRKVIYKKGNFLKQNFCTVFFSVGFLLPFFVFELLLFVEPFCCWFLVHFLLFTLQLMIWKINKHLTWWKEFFCSIHVAFM